VNRLGFYVYARDIQEKVMDEANDLDAIALMNKLVEQRLRERERSGLTTHSKDLCYNVRDAKSFRGDDFMRDIDSDIALLETILAVIKRLGLVPADPKAAALVEALRNVIGGTHPDIAAEADSPRRKAIVFTAYTDTLRHLQPKLEKAFPGRVLAVSGENFGKELRAEIVADFDASRPEGSQTDKYDILLATDKLSEGFNLNRAGLVVNYDIPWNPTRVIQRVGRIDRIGRKVFENLYIFNFFPTKKGSGVVANREIAETKMFAIHRILGEDARIFSIDEEPTPSGLYDKLAHLDDDEQISLFTEAKIAFRKIHNFLVKSHPEVLERISRFPNNVKTAWEGRPHGVYQFRRQGPGFFALVKWGDGDQIEEVQVKDAIQGIACEWGTPRTDFTPEFWRYATPSPDGPKGIYDALKRYRPQIVQKKSGGLDDESNAVKTLEKCAPLLSTHLRRFARDVSDDIRSFGTLPRYTISRISHAGNAQTPEEMSEAVQAILLDIESIRGTNYLDAVRRAAESDSIVVTVEKN
jgi:hypothetical protein